MKSLIILDCHNPELGPYLEKSVSDVFPDSTQISATYVGPEGLADFNVTMLRLERNGPEGEPVPAFFSENADSEFVIGGFCPFSTAGLDTLKNVRLLCIARGGHENILIEEATKRGIAVFHAPGRNAHSVSNAAVGLLLAEVRNIARAHHLLQQGIWQQRGYANASCEFDFNGRTLGLIGTGHIGKLVAKKMSGFDMNIIAYDPYVSQEALEDTGITLVDKETLFRTSDFISVHARLSPESYHVVGAAELAMMKPTAYLVNTARSGLIDMDALLDALQKHRIAGAGLDVFEVEPLPKDSPFLKLDNVTLTPHRAGASLDANYCAPQIAMAGVREFMEGEIPGNLCNPEVLQNAGFAAWLAQAREEYSRS